MALTRLDKIITDSGFCSRSCAKDFVRQGLVLVDGVVQRDSAAKYDSALVSVTVNGQSIDQAQHIYIMLNKPAGLLSATKDPRKPTVVGLMPKEWQARGLFPVGRLDKDTTGFLILTDDGEFAHRVISPKYNIPKLYEALVDGKPKEEDIEAFSQGIVLKDGTKCLPAKLFTVGPSQVQVEVMEGKYHQVKRMLASRHLPVLELKRLSIGKLVLDSSLALGEYRKMTSEELKMILPDYSL